MLTLKQLKETIGHAADQVSRKKDGSFIVRRGYFYRSGDAKDYMLRIARLLNEAKIGYEVVDYYDHWAPFRGGDSVAKGSHFAVVFKSKE